jgi:hypothetical protein
VWLHTTLLVHRIWRWLLDFWKICGPLYNVNFGLEAKIGNVCLCTLDIFWECHTWKWLCTLKTQSKHVIHKYIYYMGTAMPMEVFHIIHKHIPIYAASYPTFINIVVRTSYLSGQMPLLESWTGRPTAHCKSLTYSLTKIQTQPIYDNWPLIIKILKITFHQCAKFKIWQKFRKVSPTFLSYSLHIMTATFKQTQTILFPISLACHTLVLSWWSHLTNYLEHSPSSGATYIKVFCECPLRQKAVKSG